VSEGSELLVEVTILAALFCCYTVRFCITNLLCLDFEYLGGPNSNRMGLLSNRVGLFLGERVLKNMPTLLFEQPLKFITHGVFSRAYFMSCHVMSYCNIATY